MVPFHRCRNAFVVVGVLCFVLFGPARSAAQSYGMSISAYQDADVDEDGNMFAWTTVSDDSWGCTHSGYYTVANIVSPTNRTSASGSSGMSASTSLSVVDDYEEYSVYPMMTFNCSCMKGSSYSIGAPAQIYDVKPFIARMAFDPNDERVGTFPHNPNSIDVYKRHFCSGYCQLEEVTYLHSQNMGHNFLEIRGFDSRSRVTGARRCSARATASVVQPGCQPT